MLRHKPTGLIFTNRKEAKQVMGQGRYKRLALKDEFEYLNNTDN